MDEKRILIVCGGGASGGFLAQNIRKAAKKKGVKLNIKARSESEIEEYIEDIDVLLYGPHLKYMEEDLKKRAGEYNVPVEMIDEIVYGCLDGEKCLETILRLTNGKSQ